MKRRIAHSGQATRRLAGRISEHFGYVILGAWITLLLSSAAPRWMESLSTVDWIVADLQIVDGYEQPRIIYGREISRTVDAYWTVEAQSARGGTIFFRRSSQEWRYREEASGRRPWNWSAFLDNGVSPIPAVPDEPFRLCIVYNMTSDTGLRRDSAERCSPVFHPRANYTELE